MTAKTISPRFLHIATIGLPLLLCLIAIQSCHRVAAPVGTESHGQNVRIGWQTTVAIQGQLVEALKTTNYLKEQGFEPQYVAFSYGPPEVEAALAGSLDVVTLGTVPMLTLLSKSNEWVIVSRNANVRFGFVVPANSTATSLSDLRGKKIGVSLGSSAELFLLRQISANGLSAVDFDLVNIGPEEQGELARSTSWGDIAGLVSWDPTLSVLETSTPVRLLSGNVDFTWTAVSTRWLGGDSSKAAKYLTASVKAWTYYAQNRPRLNDLYREDSKLPLDSPLLDHIAQYDANASADVPSKVNIAIEREHVDYLNDAINFLVAKGSLQRDFKIEDRLDLTSAPQAMDLAKRQ